MSLAATKYDDESMIGQGLERGAKARHAHHFAMALMHTRRKEGFYGGVNMD
jgi:hypothetical protein